MGFCLLWLLLLLKLLFLHSDVSFNIAVLVVVVRLIFFLLNSSEYPAQESSHYPCRIQCSLIPVLASSFFLFLVFVTLIIILLYYKSCPLLELAEKLELQDRANDSNNNNTNNNELIKGGPRSGALGKETRGDCL